MRLPAGRHVFAAVMLLLELPILAPIIFCAAVTGLAALVIERFARLRTTLATARVRDFRLSRPSPE